MGLFDKLSEKKTCDICGNNLGPEANIPLKDGVLCGKCARKLSPFSENISHNSIADIQNQLAYRKANKDKVVRFTTTRVLGSETKIYLDENSHQFFVSSSPFWKETNPDILDFSQIIGFDVEVRETKTEFYQTNQTKEQSFSQPSQQTNYEIYLSLRIDSPYFKEITFKVHDYLIEERNSVEFREAERRANEICETLTELKANQQHSNDFHS